MLLLPRLTILRMRFRPRGINMVVHVDANSLGHDLSNARIQRIARRRQPPGPSSIAPPAHTAVVRNSRRERLGYLVFNISLLVVT